MNSEIDALSSTADGRELENKRFMQELRGAIPKLNADKGIANRRKTPKMDGEAKNVQMGHDSSNPTMIVSFSRLSRLKNLKAVRDALDFAYDLSRTISWADLIRRLHTKFIELVCHVSQTKLSRELGVRADGVVKQIEKEVMDILNFYDTVLKATDEGKITIDVVEAGTNRIRASQQYSLPEVMALLGQVITFSEDTIKIQIIMRYFLDDLGMLDDLNATNEATDIIRLVARAAEDGITEAYRFEILENIIGETEEGALLLTYRGESFGRPMEHYSIGVGNLVDNLEVVAAVLFPGTTFISDVRLFDETKTHQISCNSKDILEYVKISNIRNTSLKKSMVRRVRHQLAVFKILKYLFKLKTSRKGIKLVLVRGIDDWAKPDKAAKVFKLNLMDSFEEEMVEELQKMLIHLSGWSKWAKRSNWFKKGVHPHFVKEDLSLGAYFGGGQYRWKEFSEKTKRLWKEKHREFLAQLWGRISSGNDIDVTDFIAGIKKHKTHALPVKLLERLVLQFADTNCLIQNFRFNLMKIERRLNNAEKSFAENLLERLRNIDVKLEKESVLKFYRDLADPNIGPRLIIRVNINTYLYDALKNANNRDFYCDPNRFKVIILNENGTKIEKSLRQIQAEDIQNAELLLDFDAVQLRKLIINRINELRKSDFVNKNGIHLFEMKATNHRGRYGGIDEEKMLSELGNLVTLVCAEQIKSLIQKNREKIGKAADYYVDLMLGRKKGDVIVNVDKSLSPGPGITSRTDPGHHPIDHILSFDNGDESVYLFINDKRSHIQLKGTRKEHHYAPKHEVKKDLINGKFFSEGNPDELVASLKKRGKSKHWRSRRYIEGLETGIPKCRTRSNIERPAFDAMIEDFRRLNPAKRLQIFRNCILEHKDDGTWVFTLSLQVGMSTEGTLRSALETLQEAGKKHANLADELRQAIKILAYKGLADRTTILNLIFWIHKTKPRKKAKKAEKSLLDPHNIKQNFVEGLGRLGFEIPKNSEGPLPFLELVDNCEKCT